MYEIFEQLLEQNGGKAADVARATGINQTVFSEWKKGKSSPKTDKLQLIADYFGVKLEYLASGKESELNNPVLELEKNRLNTLINEYHNSINLLARMCKNERIRRDITEKTVSNDTGLELKKYLRFENEYENIEIDSIIKILIYFNLNISYVTGFLTATFMFSKPNENTDILDKLCVDDDLRNEVITLIQKQK